MTEKQHKEMSEKKTKKPLKAYGPMHMQPLEITRGCMCINDRFLCFSFCFKEHRYKKME